jgi:hypothetical protein
VLIENELLAGSPAEIDDPAFHGESPCSKMECRSAGYGHRSLTETQPAERASLVSMQNAKCKMQNGGSAQMGSSLLYFAFCNCILHNSISGLGLRTW